MTRQHVFIDGLGLVDPHFSGVGQYILGILRGLDTILDNAKYAGKATPDIKVIIPRDSVGRFRSFSFKHIGFKTFPLSFRVMSGLWHRGNLPPLDLWCGRGSYIFPRFVDMPLLFSDCAAIVVYDLSFELYRQYSDEGNANFLSKRVRESIKHARKVVAISRNSKQEFIDFYGLTLSEVPVVIKQSVCFPTTDSHKQQPSVFTITGR